MLYDKNQLLSFVVKETRQRFIELDSIGLLEAVQLSKFRV